MERLEYEQKLAVEVESRLIVGQRVTEAANDKEQLVPTVSAIPSSIGAVEAVLADSGFDSEAAVQAVEKTSAGDPSGTTVYAVLEKTSHHRSVPDLEKQEEPEAPAEGASVAKVKGFGV